jgi:hypothetical protein
MFPAGGADADATMGLAALAVDIANGTAYTVPALGQTGYEKMMPINSGHKDYVVIVTSGYNHDQEPSPLKVYVGMKDRLPDGSMIDYATAMSVTPSSRATAFCSANSMAWRSRPRPPHRWWPNRTRHRR